MQLHTEARVERSGTGRVARRVVTRPSTAVLVGVVVVAVLNTVDVARQAQLEIADAQTWVAAAAIFWALGTAVVIGRWPERRRTALLMLAWLLAGVAADAALDWPDSRVAVTAWLLGTALQPSLYAHMVLSYPAGRVRGKAERTFLLAAYAVGLAWQLAPALFADFRCAGCSPNVPSLLFTGHVVNLTV